MDWLALTARLFLAVVFASAAVGKLLDRQGARRALAEFGLPARAIEPAAVLLPLAELATAAALVPAATARAGAVAALCLLLAFIAAIARAMSRGEAPDCHCFGQLSSSPAGPRTLMRNGALALAAAFVAIHGPGEGIDAGLSGRSAAELAAAGLGACALLLAGLAAWLLHDNRRLRRELTLTREELAPRPAGLPIGTPAPAFSLRSADGSTIALDALLARGRPVALVFVSPGCGPCEAMFPDVARWQSTLGERMTLALVSTGTLDQHRRLSERYGLTDVLVQDGSEVAESYRVAATPSAVIVTADGTIGSSTRSTRALAEAVIRSALRSGPVLSVVQVGANGDG